MFAESSGLVKIPAPASVALSPITDLKAQTAWEVQLLHC